MQRDIRNKIRCSTLFLASLLWIFTFSSCHKYPDDPFLSFRKPTKRLSATWQFTSYKINGIEHSHDFDAFLSPKTLTDCKVRFGEYLGNTHGDFKIYDNSDKEVLPIDNEIYGFDHGDFKNMHFWAGTIYTTDTFALQFYYSLWQLSPHQSTDWNIRELYGKTLHIRYNYTDIYLKKD